MDQGSDIISDFRDTRIRTQITREILSANCHEVTEFRLMRIAGSGTASAGAGSGNEGNKAMKDGKRTKLQWIAHEASVDHAPGFSGACTNHDPRRGGISVT